MMIAQFWGPETDDFVNPMIPAGYDLVWSIGGVVILVALVVVWAVALLSIQRHSDRLPPAATAVWVGIVLFASVLGAIAWFTIGRPQARERPSAT
ncbi:PLD nuclease N-terminal domain-containing protein [Microcella indica]|uniref:PLD nuclease N-terminal domain-containing protein n=1 Tax=Microcella indica TaxID=2750620 RepID=UPI0015CF2EFE|nr:PLD nuclease N-terminal domain-containing protein [Microcella indica]